MVERAVAERAEVTPQEATLAEGESIPAPIRLVIVDDHGLVREGTAQLLKQSADFDVVGQAGSGEDGLAVLERLQPDVALIDVHLPQMSGLELARAAASSCPSVKVLILSAYDDYAYVSEALEIGVGGYLLKTATTKELVDAVRAVADGILVLDRRVADRLTRRGRSASLPGAGLTPREADILPLLARGRSNKQIATELRLGLRTVEGHVSSVLAKLGVASRAEAVAYALSHRLVVPENPGDSSDVG
jgi:NarL family two-component system response regulator LiaR